MKKITFFLMMFLSITAFSQVEIVENFDTTPGNQLPPNWTSTGFGASNLVACGGTGMGVFASINASGSKMLTTPDFTAISNGTDLTVSFSYNVFAAAGPGNFSAPPAGWGNIVLEYSTDNGANWTNITTVDDSDFTFIGATTCTNSGTITVSTLASGSDFQARFVATNTASGGLIFAIDNVSLTQESTTVPNCDAALISPVDGSVGADTDVTLNWQAATGFADGYTVSVGTTSGGTEVVNAATTTETNYALTGLAFDTPYFVNIVPYNSFGDATGCTEESFTTRSEPIPGATCGTPIVVTFTGGLYATQNNTANFEDNIDTSPCSNSYMSGKDVFYQIAPTADMSINIDMSGIDNNGASIHVVEGCPDVATECLAYVGTFNTDPRNLSDIVLLAGHTYFVVLSNSGSTRTYNYNLIITQNSCINPAFELTPVSDCDNGQFNIDVDVTYLGSATTLTLSDDDPSTADVTVSATGIANIGPYPSGTTVSVTLTNDDDGSCSYNDSTYFYCPPSNDDCDTSILLDINTDDTCTLFTSATNAGALESVGDPTSCANTNTNDVWFSFTATAESLILEYLNITEAIGSGGTIQATELLEGSCGTLTSLNCYTTNYVNFTGLTIGNTYYIRNSTRLGGEYAQNYDICLKEPPAAPANDECSNAATLTLSTDDQCDNQVTGTTIGATVSTDQSCGNDYNDVWYVFNPTVTGIYNFTLQNNGSTVTRYVVYEGTCGALTQKSASCTSSDDQLFTLNNGTSYYVMVRTSQSGPGVSFNLCVYQLPDAVANNDCSTPTTILESIDSTGNNTINGSLENSYPSPENCNAGNNAIWYSFTPTYTGMYNFDFTRGMNGSAYYAVFGGDDCANLSNDITGLTSCFNSSDKTGDLVAGNTYLISVHASSSTADFALFIYPDPTLGVASNSFEAFTYYPNPVENTLTVKAGKTISKISVFNIVGQEVQTLMPNNLQTKIEMGGMNNGVYFVTVTINEAQKTFKVIKN